MPDCQSGAVHSPGCGTIIGIAVAGDFSLFVTPIERPGLDRKISPSFYNETVLISKISIPTIILIKPVFYANSSTPSWESKSFR
jgi:hypothetical protein